MAHETTEELQARSVIGQASCALRSRGTSIGIEVDPGPRRNREGLGPRLTGVDALRNLVNGGVPGESATHSVVGIHGQNVGLLRKGHRVAADPRTEIDDKRTGKAAGLVAGHRLGCGLLEANGVEPHPIAPGEFRPGSCPAVGQPDRGGDDVRGRKLPPPGEVGRPRIVDFGHLGQQPLPWFLAEHPGFRVVVATGTKRN